MVTDTGRFSFSGVTGDTLRLAAETLEAGANYVDICQNQFQRRTLAATKLLGVAIGSMKLYFDLMIRKIAEKLYDPHPQKENAFYGTLCNLRNAIRLKPQKAWTIEEICQEINISRSDLQHLYKSFFGVSITTDIQYSRIEYAKHLLSSTNLTVYNVSASCGYPSDVHFMRVFKKATGITPSQFRTEFGILQKEIDAGKNMNPFTKKQ